MYYAFKNRTNPELFKTKDDMSKLNKHNEFTDIENIMCPKCYNGNNIEIREHHLPYDFRCKKCKIKYFLFEVIVEKELLLKVPMHKINMPIGFKL